MFLASSNRLGKPQPLPSNEGCRPPFRIIAAPGRSTKELGMEKREGGPKKWEAQAVRHEKRTTTVIVVRFRSPFSFCPHPPLTPLRPTITHHLHHHLHDGCGMAHPGCRIMAHNPGTASQTLQQVQSGEFQPHPPLPFPEGCGPLLEDVDN